MSRTGDAPVRRRVLISAYACGPNEESEASAGWAFAVAAAAHNDVVVVTRARFRPEVERALDGDPHLKAHLEVVYLEAGDLALRLKRGPGSVYWYYVLWQRKAARLIAGLHEARPFDVAHHVTFASDWLPTALDRTGIPFVWGPVGGSTPFPWHLSGWIPPRARVAEFARDRFTAALRRIWGDRAATRARVVVCQNHDVARRFASCPMVVVEPNAAFRGAPEPLAGRSEREERSALFVGRLLPWKGVRLAIAAIADPRLTGWSLDVVGTGPDGAALRRYAEELAVGDRVRFRGQLPRPEVLGAMRKASVFLFPSLHDSAGWVVGEASESGCPVVCLDVGGPPLLAGPNGFPVATGSTDVISDLVDAVLAASDTEGTAYPRWRADRLPDIVEAWYAAATAGPTR
jgi:glycosyltransferase involved in cell wall biosynthesis